MVIFDGFLKGKRHKLSEFACCSKLYLNVMEATGLHVCVK